MLMYEGAAMVISLIEKRNQPKTPAPPAEQPYDPFSGESR
jgi:hypothetical protein